jgi:hypothetical protein
MSKEKSKWQIAKSQIVEYAIKDLKDNYGITITPEKISPKVYRDKPDHVLLFTDEFTSDLIYIMYNKDYTSFCDEYGSRVTQPIYYTINKDKVAVSEYSKAVGGSPKSWALPVNDLIKLKKKSVPATLEFDFDDDDDDDDDQNISALTIRDFYAIIQNKPVSSKSWLNTLIRKNND